MPNEWYVSFHGGEEKVTLNNIHVYSTDGKRLRKALNKKSLPAGIFRRVGKARSVQLHYSGNWPMPRRKSRTRPRRCSTDHPRAVRQNCALQNRTLAAREGCSR